MSSGGVMRNLFFRYAASLAAAVIVAVLAAGAARNLGLADQAGLAEKAADELKLELASHTSHSQIMGALVAMGLTQPELKRAVAAKGRDAVALLQSMEALRPLRGHFGLDGLYLIDATGQIIAHETEGKPSTGADVAFRPYFKQAMAGKANVYAAVGGQTGERGLYYATPVHGDLEGSPAPLGVVMAKLPGENLDLMLKKYGDAAVLLSPQGVVFASSRPDWIYALSGAAGAGRVEEIKKLKQFGARFESGTVTSLPFPAAADTASFDGGAYLLAHQTLDWGDPGGPWRIALLWSETRAFPPGLLAGVAAVSGGLAFLIAFMAVLLAQGRARRLETARRFKFLGTAMEASPLAVVMADAQGLIRWVNPRFESLTGHPPAEAIGQDPKILSSGLTPKATIKELWNAILSGRPFTGEFINKRKDGSLYHARNVVTPVKDENGGLLGFVSLQEDVTSQKEAAEAILRAQAEMTQIFNTSASGMRVLDRDFNVVKVNGAFVELSGYAREELEGRKCHEIFGGTDCHTEDCPLERILNGEDRIEATALCMKKDGTPVYCEMTATSYRAPNGEIIGVIEDFRDMTERMKAQHLIKQSEGKYRELVESASSIILKLDMEGNVIFFNEFAQSFFGFTLDEVLDKPVVGTIVPETESGGRDLAALIREILAHPDLHGKNENENIRKDGRRVWISWTNKIILDDVFGTPKGLLCIGLDATERKKAQDALHDALEVISGSIRYASRIQRAILPAPEQTGELLPRHFALWEPRDVVGGDIYWIRPWGQGTLAILADCTGHGVPGAFITLIGSGALDRAMAKIPPGDPAGLIARMNTYVKTVLSQDLQYGQEEGSDDGLELGVCYIPPERDILAFAGAHFNLFTVDGEEVDMIKGDRKGIGYRFVPPDASFVNHHVDIRPGRRFYLTTDGLIDQIGGDPKRSFGRKRFTALLASLRDVPLEEQGVAIFEALEAHRGDESRRDDVSVLGFEA
jgi:PAS domain S-box-containing protein